MKSFQHILTVCLLLSFGHAFAKDNANLDIFLFKENKGQLVDQNNKLRNDILYYGSSDGLSYFFKKTGISYQLYLDGKGNDIQISRIDMIWVGANPDAEIISDNKAITIDNFYNTVQKDGIIGVRNFGDLQYKGIYKGIDLHYYYKNGSLKYDFIVAPHADYKNIQIKIEGATSLKQNKDGTVSIVTPNGILTEGMPVAFQGEKEVKSIWILNKGILSFLIPEYDAALPLIIDPLVYQWGKNNVDVNSGTIANTIFAKLYSSVSDIYGNIYATSSFTLYGGTYVKSKLYKYSSDGNVIWSAISSDPTMSYSYTLAEGISLYNNSIYYCGYTNQSGIATTGAYQTSFGGQYDAYLTKYDSSGTKLWVTYYGGSDQDSARSCKTDSVGNIYMRLYKIKHKYIKSISFANYNRRSCRCFYCKI